MSDAGPPDDFRSAYLGRFNEFEVPIVLDILAEGGIRAFSKNNPSDSAHNQYGHQMFFSDVGVVLVDAARVDEARALVDEELPKYVESARETMSRMEEGDFDSEPNGN
jgi:hypothetical protein